MLSETNSLTQASSSDDSVATTKLRYRSPEWETERARLKARMDELGGQIDAIKQQAEPLNGDYTADDVTAAEERLKEAVDALG